MAAVTTMVMGLSACGEDASNGADTGKKQTSSQEKTGKGTEAPGRPTSRAQGAGERVRQGPLPAGHRHHRYHRNQPGSAPTPPVRTGPAASPPPHRLRRLPMDQPRRQGQDGAEPALLAGCHQGLQHANGEITYSFSTMSTTATVHIKKQ